MAGANIFVMYSDGNGNVTVSPRLGKGHFEPEHDTAAKISVLEGSGIANGKMVANVRCENCQSWQGGSMDFTSDSGDWIHAAKEGEPIDSTDLDAEIEQHQDNGLFEWDFTKAQGGSALNPFANSEDDLPVSSAPNSDDGGNDVVSSEGGEEEEEPSDMLVTAHGAIGALAFLVFFPSGAIFIRVPFLSKFGGIWVHAAIQIFAYCLFIAAAGLGIYIAMAEDLLMEAHPIIGMVLLGVLFFQPFSGIAHHMLFKKHKKRTAVSYEHIFVGRGAIILGMINGGLGLMLAGVENIGYLVAYGIVAGVMGSLYLAAIVYGELKRSRNMKDVQDEERKESR